MPVGTLVVNVTGSFLLGLLANVAPPTLTVLGVGGLGAYTTFSSFARDAVALSAVRQLSLAAVYIVSTCALGITAAAAGVAIAS
jgi:CrcB protein